MSRRNLTGVRTRFPLHWALLLPAGRTYGAGCNNHKTPADDISDQARLAHIASLDALQHALEGRLEHALHSHHIAVDGWGQGYWDRCLCS